jgi:TRAP-type mannitol/chloroaromatic compound transport system permease small subunit
MLYGTLVMLAGAYTLSRNAHVRGDFLYRAWSPRTQATLDLALYVLFFFPGMLAFIYAGFGFAKFSWLMNEHSSASPNGPPVYHFKALIPITGVLMVLQGIVETIRCIICVRAGAWPQRLHDVEELDKIMLEKAEHGEYEVVKELEDIGQRKGAV